MAFALGDLSEDVVFVGGATVGLLITDSAAPTVRPTKDVDVVIEVASYADYNLTIVPRLRESGFRECMEPDAPICAWQVAGIRVDVMPTEGDVLGFTNRWYPGVVKTADPHVIDDVTIRVISAVYFLATKFVAFDGRGANDYYGSHDLEDIVALVDGRPEVVEDVRRAPDDVRGFVIDRAEALLRDIEFLNALPGHVEPGRDETVLERLRFISRTSEQVGKGTSDTTG